MTTTYRESTAAAQNVTDQVMDSVTDAAGAAVKQGKRLAQDVSETAGRAADYLRESDVREIGGKVRDYLQANPTHAMIGAAFVGFVVGRMLSRH